MSRAQRAVIVAIIVALLALMLVVAFDQSIVIEAEP
jgi:hypothetical protein